MCLRAFEDRCPAGIEMCEDRINERPGYRYRYRRNKHILGTPSVGVRVLCQEGYTEPKEKALLVEGTNKG